MKFSRRNLLKAAAVSAGSVALGAPALVWAQNRKFDLKAAVNVPMTHSIYLRMQEAAEAIKNDTGGEVNVRVFPNGQLGSDTDMLSQIRSGGLEMLCLPGVILANLIPLASLNSVGFAFLNYPEVWKGMDGNLGAFIRSQIEKSNLVVYEKVWDNGFRHITSHAPVNTPADLSGMKIRVPVSPLLLSLFKSLNASPTPINFSELYSALQTKVVDAQENPLPIIESGKLYEVQPYCAMTSHVWDGYWMLANKRFFGRMPKDAQTIVMSRFNESGMRQRADSEKAAIDLKAALEKQGMRFTQPDAAAFREALGKGGFYAEWKQKFGNEAWAQLEASVGNLS